MSHDKDVEGHLQPIIDHHHNERGTLIITEIVIIIVNRCETDRTDQTLT